MSTLDDSMTLEEMRATLARCREEIGKVMIGQEAVIDRALICLLAGQHGLIEGVGLDVGDAASYEAAEANNKDGGPARGGESRAGECRGRAHLGFRGIRSRLRGPRHFQ